jgi:hypothetical protein
LRIPQEDFLQINIRPSHLHPLSFLDCYSDDGSAWEISTCCICCRQIVLAVTTEQPQLTDFTSKKRANSGLRLMPNNIGFGDGTDRLPATMARSVDESYVARLINSEFAERHDANSRDSAGIADGRIAIARTFVHGDKAPEAFIGTRRAQLRQAYRHI